MGEQLKLEDEEVSITLRRAWDRALRGLAARVNKPTFEAHIRTLRPLSLAEEPAENGDAVLYAITLGVPSAFTREWVSQRHGPLIQGLLEEVLDRDVRLRFVLTPRNKAAADPATGRGKNLFSDEEATPAPVPVTAAKTQSKAAEPRTALPDIAGDLFGNTGADAPKPGKLPAEPVDTAWENDPLSFKPSPVTAPPRPPAEPRRAPAAGNAGASTGSTGSKRSSIANDTPLLNSRYTFENFVTGPSNRLAHAGAKAVAQSPGQIYNPLFLYGPSGLGKTHLMHAIGNEIASEKGIDPRRVAYFSGETFTSQYITSLREQRADEFRRKWRSVDLWLVDDIQFIAAGGKEHTKEEFFHTFNALYQTGKQIVISSDRSPRELRMMDERLRSRFECGLIADIAPPDLETRLAILHRKADGEGMRIPDDVLLYMAKLVQSNIRTLEGALVKLVAYASVVNSPVTTELASSILERYYIAAGIGADGTPSVGDDPAGAVSSVLGRGYDGRGEYGAISAELVQRVVAKRFGLTPDALSGKKRDRDIVNARQIAMHLMRELTEMSLPGIGQMFARDHSTVMHSCDKVKTQIPYDDDLKSLVEDLTTQLRAQAAG